MINFQYPSEPDVNELTRLAREISDMQRVRGVTSDAVQQIVAAEKLVKALDDLADLTVILHAKASSELDDVQS